MLNSWVDHKCLWRIDRVEAVNSRAKASVTVGGYHTIENGGLAGREKEGEEEREEGR